MSAINNRRIKGPDRCRRQQLRQSFPSAHLIICLTASLDSFLSDINRNDIPGILQHHLVGADGLSSEDATSLVKVDVSTNKRQRWAEVTAVCMRAETT